MTDLRSIRLKTGMTQKEFSLHLGIGRTLLSMVESKQRHLPIKALLKLQPIIDALAEIEQSEKKQETVSDQKVFEQWLTEQRTICSAKIKQYHALILKIETYEIAVKLSLKKSLSNPLSRRTHNSKLEKQKLYMKIDLATNERDFIEQRLNDLKSGANNKAS